MLSEILDKLSAGDVAHGENFRPFSKACDREFWNGTDRETAVRLISEGEACAGKTWPVLTATLYMDIAGTGSRSVYETPYYERRAALSNLVFAECVEYKGRFINDITDLVWCICEESNWCIPAHKEEARIFPDDPLIDPEEPVIELFSAETASLLAFTRYLLGDELRAVSVFVPLRIEREIEHRIMRSYIERDDYWWMGFGQELVNNCNVWVNSNCIICFLLLEKDGEWLMRFLRKAAGSIDVFMDRYGDDGSCDEGPGYWAAAGGALFDCLELLYIGSGGKIDLFGNEKVKRIGSYIYKVYIGEGNFINFADCGRYSLPDPGLPLRIGKRINDEKMTAFAKHVHMSGKERWSNGWHVLRKLCDLVTMRDIENAPSSNAFYLKEHWFESTQMMTARQEAGSTDGFFLAAKGGHNGESHNHNDVGNFILYRDCAPIIIDLGVEGYTAQTFSNQRYEIWTMQSRFHNLPTINGVQQKDGRKHAASNVKYESDGNKSKLMMDIKYAYPEEAAVEKWVRIISFDRAEEEVEIRDEYSLFEAKGETVLNYMTNIKPDEQGKGRLALAGITLEYPACTAEYACEEYQTADRNLKEAWGDKVYRLRFKLIGNPQYGLFYIKVTIHK